MRLPTLGRSHPLVRRLRVLRRDRAARDAENVFLAEGLHLAEAALESAAPVERALVAPQLAERAEGQRLLAGARAAGWELHEVAATVLAGLQDAHSPQPIVCVCRRSAPTLEELLPSPGRPLLVAVGVQDPGNLGSILRTAHAAGAAGLVACGGADLYHPRAVRASAGSIFRLGALSLGLDAVFDGLRAAGVTTLAAVPRGGTPHTALRANGATALIVGGEGAGLPPELLQRVDGLAHIPMRPGAESLSVGAAAAVLLYELARGRF